MIALFFWILLHSFGTKCGSGSPSQRFVLPVVRNSPHKSQLECELPTRTVNRHVGSKNLIESRWHYLQCALAGAISCSTTHGLMVPLDVIKTTLQTDASMSQVSIVSAFKSILSHHGPKAFFEGFSAVYSGYFLQGAAKFGFYEYFKSKIPIAMQNFNGGTPLKPNSKLPIYIVSSGLAEIIASIALTPMEVTKIDMMTNPLSKGKHVFAAMALIVQQGGLKSLFRGLPLIMLRQVPYTCVKLAGYDLIVEALRRLTGENAIRSTPIPADATHKQRLDIRKQRALKVARKDIYLQLASGVMAGLLAATLSHPADVMLSKMCGATSLTSCIIVQSLRDILMLMRDLGVAGCFQGLKARAIMTAIMTAGQFGIYEQAKQYILDFSYDARLENKHVKHIKSLKFHEN